MVSDLTEIVENRINETFLYPLAQDRVTSTNEIYDADDESSSRPYS